MKFIIDSKIPYIQGALEPYGEVIYLPGNEITKDVVKDADALVIRTRTICNELLLSGSTVKFIATATIGYDHIDTVYCREAGITWTNAPGCNSGSVEQYVASALVTYADTKNLDLKNLSIGVVGVGHVGSKVARLCRLLGMKVLLNDPPRARTEGPSAFVSLEHIMAEADIISLHIPLNLQGEDATYHLADAGFFSGLKHCQLLINTCRGEVVNTSAIKTALAQGQVSEYICDCWEQEPDIDIELLSMAWLATPHIAGYSRDGKAVGTLMSIREISRYFALDLNHWQPAEIELPRKPVFELNGLNKNEQQVITEAILATYDIRADDVALRNNPSRFELLRGDYPVRREFTAYTIVPVNIADSTIELLKNLGFGIAAA
jgi:erythronate-4-phosphate dehydrogenase